MKYLNYIKYPLFQSILLSLLMLHRWLLFNQDLVFENYLSWLLPTPPIWIILFLLNFVVVFLLVLKKIKLNNSLYLFIFVFFIFQLINYIEIDPVYFWNTIPDSRTYKILGETFIECGRLAIQCNGVSNLDWPIGQPIISGLLSTYFYSSSQYIYLALFSSSVYVIGKISNIKFKNYYIFGITYFFLIPNNYELIGFIISEVPYVFFTSLFLLFLFKENLKLSFIFAVLTFFIRTIGVINIFILFIYLFKKHKSKLLKFIFIFLFICFCVASYNYLFNEKFVVSTTITTNIQGDSLYKDENVINFIINSFDLENFNFVYNNVSRLYGDGSRDCVFEYCFMYNPLFTKEGSVPQLLNNSLFGEALNALLVILFKLTSPLEIYKFIPFLFLLLFKKNDLFNNLLLLTYFLNIFLSVLTSEYGSRWWLLPNLLSIYLFSNLIYFTIKTFSRYRK